MSSLKGNTLHLGGVILSCNFYFLACLAFAGITILVLGVLLRMRKKTSPDIAREMIYLPPISAV